MTLVGTAARRYRFGRFVLDPDRRQLTADGAPVTLGSRAYDILQLLIERRDVVVSRDDILACVWRGTMVEGNTLAVQISALRRALGETQVIATVPGRGYRFVGSVADEVEREPDAKPDHGVITLPRDVPAVPPAIAMPGSRPAEHRIRTRWLGVAGALVLVVIALFGLLLRHDPRTPGAPRLSMVVLPFRNLGGDVQQEYLADAISDDLTTDLSHIPGSIVIARASADTYKGRAVAADIIGKALNVRYLLEGSIRAEGAGLHINAQLIDAPTGMHLWADAFDTSRSQLDTARAEIVRHIANALNVTLVDIEGARSLRERPENPDAVDLYLRARSLLDRSYSLAGLIDAEALLERAVASDPGYIEASIKLAVVLLHKITDFDDSLEVQDHERATTLINTTINEAPQNASAVAAKGQLELVDHKCEEAEASFKLALKLDNENLAARHGLAQCARMLGQMGEMISVLEDTLQFEPAGPQNASDQHLIGMGFLFLGKIDEAIQWLNRAGAGIAEANNKETSFGWQEWREIYLIAATDLKGDKERAKAYYNKYVKTYFGRTVWQLASYDTKAQAALPIYPSYLKALHESGMPDYLDEYVNFHIPASAKAQDNGDFDPTPLEVPGATRIDTTSLYAMLQSDRTKPTILDLGRGATAIPESNCLRCFNIFGNDLQLLDQAITTMGFGDRKIVVMSDGPLGWKSYNAVLRLVANSVHNVLWYRGGEQAWSQAGLPIVDRRSP